jgi:hypothetical protein
MTAKLATVDDHILAGVEAAGAVGGGSIVPRSASDKLQVAFTQFDSGYLSPYFVTDPERMEVAFENAYILIHEKQIGSKKDLLPLLEQITNSGKPLVIIAGDVRDEALATLVVKNLSGPLRVAAVRAPGSGDQRKKMFQGIATLTGGNAITEGPDIQLKNIQISDLGQAAKITIDKNCTVVDPRPFQAVVDQANAQFNVATAQLTQSQADVEAAKAEIDRAEAAQVKTQLDVKRYSPLVKDGTVSQQEMDDTVQSNLANEASVVGAKGKYDHSLAAVKAAEAQIEVARSSLQGAQLNLGFTKVKSPINGIAGIRVANIGDLVGTDQKALLTTVSQIDPIFVQFPISEQEYLDLRKLFLSKASRQEDELELILSDGSVYDHKGRLTTRTPGLTLCWQSPLIGTTGTGPLPKESSGGRLN